MCFDVHMCITVERDADRGCFPMEKRQAGVDWMKRKIVLGYMLAACMVLASCQGKDSGLDVMARGGQQGDEAVLPDGKI